MKELYLANPIIDIDIKDIPNIYFTSDLHFNHNNIIKYSHRPFKDAEEMNTILLNNLNEELSKSVNPILFNAGDFMFGKVSMYEDLMEQIKAKHIYNVIGNHDIVNLVNNRVFVKGDNRVEWCNEYIIRIKKDKKFIFAFTLSHYPKPFNCFYGAFNLHGHFHEEKNIDDMTGSDKNKAIALIENGFYYDVGVDGNDYKPVKLENILKGQTTLPKMKCIDYSYWKNVIKELYEN